MTRRFLALGDSYTIGEGVAAESGWPAQLAELLSSRAGFAVDAPEIIAQTGWTTDELAVAIEARAPRPGCDLVTLLVGVNDQYRGRSAESYRLVLRELVDVAMNLAGGDARHLIVISIPDWSVTPFAGADPRGREALAREIDRFNLVARAVALDVGARWADVTAISRAAANEPALLTSDGLHPSMAMYAQWAAALLPHAMAVLAR